WYLLLAKYMPLLTGHKPSAGMRLPSRLTPRIHLATAVTVGAGIDRMVQHPGEDRAAGTTPFELTGLGTFMPPNAELEDALYEVGEYRGDRAELFELLENQSHGSLHLLIRIQSDLAGGPF